MRLHQSMIAFAVIGVSQLAAHAQWPVYDVKTWVQLKQMYTTAEETRSQVIAAYNLAHQMSLVPSQLYTQWRTSLTQWDTLNAGNSYGNTAGWILAANNGINATRAYFGPNLTTRVYPAQAYNSMGPRSQQIISSQYATTELNDGIGQSNLATLGAIRANGQARAQALEKLRQATTSTDPAQHTQMATLQRINVALLMLLEQQQEANQIATSAALEQMIGHKTQIDALKQSFQDGAAYHETYQNTMGQWTSGLTQALNQRH